MTPNSFMRLLILLLLIVPRMAFSQEFSLFAKQALEMRREQHPWHRYIREFRSEHHFSFVTGVSQGQWNVAKFGTLRSQTYSSTGFMSKFQYRFHLPIYRGFGYVLGSSIGYHFESADRRQDFKPVPSILMPGFYLGLVQNFNPALRMLFGIEAYSERFEGLAEDDSDNEEDPTISVSMLTIDMSTAFDLFYDLNWAVRFEAHRRQSRYTPPDGVSSVPAIDAEISRNDEWYGFGLVYHFL